MLHTLTVTDQPSYYQDRTLCSISSEMCLLESSMNSRWVTAWSCIGSLLFQDSRRGQVRSVSFKFLTISLGNYCKILSIRNCMKSDRYLQCRIYPLRAHCKFVQSRCLALGWRMSLCQWSPVLRPRRSMQSLARNFPAQLASGSIPTRLNFQ